MSGTIGHMMYAVLGAKAAAQRRLPVAPIIHRHFASYLAGSYLGCDIQTMPEAICVDTGQEVGYGTAPLTRSPVTGGEVRPFRLAFKDQQYSPYQIHEMFYGRAHVTFGWGKAEQELVVPWDHLPDYCALAVQDTLELFGPGERPLAYVLGWMTHLIGDGLIKSIHPGITLNLLDGKYTPRNRPVQDLVTFHEVGRKELGLNWHALLADAADTPVEPVQAHYMRMAEPRGKLAETFREGWLPERHELLMAVLAENRRYFRAWSRHELKELELKETADGWQCSEALSRQAGGLTYAKMVQAAEMAGFRNALLQMGEAIADLFAEAVRRQPLLEKMPASDGPGWKELMDRWRPPPIEPSR